MTTTPPDTTNGSFPTTTATPPLPVGKDFRTSTGTFGTPGDKPESTVEVVARPGSTGSVKLSGGQVLNITLPGPAKWDLTQDPDGPNFDLIDRNAHPDGSAEDVFPEPGGLSVITLRALRPGQATFVAKARSGSKEPSVTLRVTVT